MKKGYRADFYTNSMNKLRNTSEYDIYIFLAPIFHE